MWARRPSGPLTRTSTHRGSTATGSPWRISKVSSPPAPSRARVYRSRLFIQESRSFDLYACPGSRRASPFEARSRPENETRVDLSTTRSVRLSWRLFPDLPLSFFLYPPILLAPSKRRWWRLGWRHDVSSPIDQRRKPNAPRLPRFRHPGYRVTVFSFRLAFIFFVFVLAAVSRRIREDTDVSRVDPFFFLIRFLRLLCEDYSARRFAPRGRR